jgi:heme-degrading monooxygenase HmoA
VVGGWTEFQFAERRLPTLDEINAAAPDTPVFVLHLYDRAFLNGAALRAVGSTKDAPNPPGGEIQRNRTGNPTGLLIARPNASILYATLAKGPKLSRADQLNSTRQCMRELNRFGITSAIEAGGGFQNYPEDKERILMGTDAGPNDREGAPPSSARGTHDSTPYPDMVASVIQHQVRAGAEAQYEAWLRKITPVAEGFPGHRGVEWTRPREGTHTYTVTLRFDTQEHAQGWLRSDVRRQLIAEVEPPLEQGPSSRASTALCSRRDDGRPAERVTLADREADMQRPGAAYRPHADDGVAPHRGRRDGDHNRTSQP